jgi:hypothetical protein
MAESWKTMIELVNRTVSQQEAHNQTDDEAQLEH